MTNELRDQIHAAASRALEKMYIEWGITPGLPTPAVAMHRMANFLADEGWRPPPRVLTDPADLDALPLMSVVLAYGVAHQAVPAEHGDAPVWFKPTGVAARTSVELLSDTTDGRVVVLHEPMEDDL